MLDLEVKMVLDSEMKKVLDSEVKKVLDSEVKKVLDSEVKKVLDSEVKMVHDRHNWGVPGQGGFFLAGFSPFHPAPAGRPCFATRVILAGCFPLAFLNKLMYKANLKHSMTKTFLGEFVLYNEAAAM